MKKPLRFPLIGSVVRIANLRNLSGSSGMGRIFCFNRTGEPTVLSDVTRLEFEYRRSLRDPLFRVELRRLTKPGNDAHFRVVSVQAFVGSDDVKAYELGEASSDKPYLKEAKFRKIISADPPPVNLFEEEREDSSTMPRDSKKVSGKQVALLLARAASAGYKTEVRFLEWLEYESGLRLNYESVEDIDACFVDDILEKLS